MQRKVVEWRRGGGWVAGSVVMMGLVWSICAFSGRAYAQPASQTHAGTSGAASALTPNTALTAATLKKFTGSGLGSGALTFSDCPDISCPTIGTCSCYTASDTVIGTGIGKVTFDSEMSFETVPTAGTATFTDNGSGGICAGVSGFATFTFPNSEEIDLLVQGTSCDVLGFGIGAMSGTYVVDGGTGKRTGAFGEGSFTFAEGLPSGTNVVSFNGTLKPK
jgi:hypothetical protein